MRSGLLLAIVSALVLFTVPARANFVWDFSSPAGDMGTSHAFTSTPASVTITAAGFFNNGTTRHIYGKQTAGNPTETGMGFTDQANHEIDTAGYMELDLNNITNGTALALTVTSLQAGETYNVYTATVAGGVGPGAGSNLTLVPPPARANSPYSFTKLNTFRYLAIEAANADVLLGTLSTTAVPEPQYYGLLLMGMSGLAVAEMRRRRQTRKS